jgi:hypothetical protein
MCLRTAEPERPLLTQKRTYRDLRRPGGLRLVAQGTEFGSSRLCYARRSGGRIQGEL